MDKKKQRIISITIVILLAIMLLIPGLKEQRHPSAQDNPQKGTEADHAVNEDEAYENAAKEIVFWYSDASCGAYFEKCAKDYYNKTKIAVDIVYKEPKQYLEQIYDASMAEQDFPDIYLTWNDAKEKAYLYGVAEEKEYAVFFNTLILAYHTDSFQEAPETIQEILEYGQNNLLGDGVGNLLEWNMADGYYDYPFTASAITWREEAGTLTAEYNKEKYNQNLKFVKMLSETIDMDPSAVSRKTVLDNFNIEETLTAIIDSDDLDELTGDTYGIAVLPGLNEELEMQGCAETGVLLLNEFSAKKETAASFAEFVQNEEAEEISSMTNHISLKEEVLSSQYEKTAFTQYEKSRLVTASPDAGEFWAKLRQDVIDVWNGKELPE